MRNARRVVFHHRSRVLSQTSETLLNRERLLVATVHEAVLLLLLLLMLQLSLLLLSSAALFG